MGVNVDLTGQVELLVPDEGTLLQPDDWARSAASGSIGLAALSENLVGQLLGLFDVRNALPAVAPITVTPTGGMNLQISGSASTASGTQRVIAQGRPLDTCPITPETLAAADPTNPRIDLICVKAARVQGSTKLTRTVRADNAPGVSVIVSGTLVAGDSAPIDISGYGFTTAPKASGAPCPIGDTSTGTLRISVLSATQLRVKSSDAADTRQFSLELSGTPTGWNGAPTDEFLWENQPQWRVVTGTPAPSPAVPATPSGWEAFATVYVPAGSSAITAGEISYLFPAVPSFNVLATADIAGTFSIPCLGGFILKGGTIPNLPADGTASETPYNFPVAFPHRCLVVADSVDFTTPLAGGNDLGAPITVRFDSRSRSGFNVTAGGGPPGSTISVNFLAFGY